MPEIRYSRDRKYYYVEELATTKSAWVSVEHIPDGENVLPFILWKVKRNIEDIEIVTPDHPLVLRYYDKWAEREGIFELTGIRVEK